MEMEEVASSLTALFAITVQLLSTKPESIGRALVTEPKTWQFQ